MPVSKESLLRLADCELKLYRELLEQIKEAMDLIQAEDMEGLMLVIQRKQQILSRQVLLADAWSDIGAEMGIMGGRSDPEFWDSFLSKLPDNVSYPLKEALEQVRALAVETLRAERVAQEVLGKYVEALRAKMALNSRGKNALKSYAAPSGMGFGGR